MPLNPLITAVRQERTGPYGSSWPYLGQLSQDKHSEETLLQILQQILIGKRLHVRLLLSKKQKTGF